MKKIILLMGALLAFSLQAKETVHFVVPFAPGGSTDKVARTLIKHLSELEVVIDYKPGAGSMTGTNYVASVKTGTVLLVVSTATVIAPLRKESLATYDIEKDFVLVGNVGIEPTMLLVKDDGKINDFKELVRMATNTSLTFSTPGVGTQGHLAGALLNEQISNAMKFIHVPYRGSALSTLAVLTGEVLWTAESQISVKEFILAKKLKPIAVFSPNRIKEFPGVPTLTELGVDDKGFYRWHSVVANAAADEKVISYIRTRMNSAEFKKDMVELGIDSSTPPLADFFKNETAKTSRILQSIRE